MIVEAPLPHKELAKLARVFPYSSRGSRSSIRVVKMHDDEPMYQPNTIQIVAGDTIEWENDGQVSHSVSDDATRAWQAVDALHPPGSQPFNSGAILPGGRFRYTFTSPGRYRYFDLAHEINRMVGEVIVAPRAPNANSESIRNADGLAADSGSAIAE